MTYLLLQILNDMKYNEITSWQSYLKKLCFFQFCDTICLRLFTWQAAFELLPLLQNVETFPTQRSFLQTQLAVVSLADFQLFSAHLRKCEDQALQKKTVKISFCHFNCWAPEEQRCLVDWQQGHLWLRYQHFRSCGQCRIYYFNLCCKLN